MMTTITPKYLWYISGAFLLAALSIVLVGRFFFSHHEPTLVENSPSPPHTALTAIPQGFIQATPLEEALHSFAFRLDAIDRPVRLPDLRSLILYYGSNDRPDRSLSKRRLQFGMRGIPAVNSVVVGEKVFFKYDTKSNKWVISERTTPLTAAFSPLDQNASVTVEFRDEKGVSVTTPSEFHTFTLTPSPTPPSSAQSHQWFIGSLSVDNALLDHQGAIWWGQDEVVQAFGGEEMAREKQRQRVQFGTGDDAYVIWVGEGDCFVFDEDQWRAEELGKETVGKPLLKAKSIDTRAIHFQLWNPEGTAHHSIDLLHREAQGEIKIPEIKMIGARSKNHWIAEIQGKRLTLSPDDWVLLKQDGFVQINDEHILDDYLQGRLCGNLLAFSGIEKVSGELCLIGTFFDTTRTRQAPFAISLYRSWDKKDQRDKKSSSDDDDSDDDDFYDDDLDLGDDDEDVEDDEIEEM